MARTVLKWVGGGLLAAFVGIQLVPYGPSANPPGRVEPAWDSPETRALAVRACFDCHSHETVWPWYSYVAPVSWLVRDHVDEGRAHLNFSAWDQPQEDADEAAEVLQEGEMPPAYYGPLHPEARLTEAERAALIAGFRASLGGGGGEHAAAGSAERGEGHGGEAHEGAEGAHDRD